MSRSAIIAVVVAVVVLAGGSAVLVAHHNSSKKDASSMDMSKVQPSNINNKTPIATDKVTIQDLAFEPGNITVKKGTTVTWTNQDSFTHTVTETDGKTGPNSGDLAHGKSYSFTFDTAGTYSYHCDIHPGMKGTVKVTE